MEVYQTNFFRNLVAVILLLLVVYLGYTLYPVLRSILGFVSTILFPFFLAMVFYYLLRPLLEKLKTYMSFTMALILTLCALIAFFVLISAYLYPVIAEQALSLKTIKIENILKLQDTGLHYLTLFRQKIYLSQDIIDNLLKLLANVNDILIKSVFNFLSLLPEILLALGVFPFILFYFLKDDEKIHDAVRRNIPPRYLATFENFSEEADKALLHFINGRVLVSILTTLLLFLTFVVIRMDHIFILCLFSFIFYIVPTLGAFMAMILPLIVGFSISTTTGFEVLIIMLIASTIEGYVFTPLIMGKQLVIHPLTIILILLISGYLFGIVGFIVATPLYVIIKILVKHIIKYIHLKNA